METSMTRKPIARLLIPFLLLIAFCGLWLSGQSPQKPLVLRGGLLIDGKGGVPLDNAVVVISGGKIQSVGREGSVTIPAEATVMNTSGKTILPGLVDSHVHFRN